MSAAPATGAPLRCALGIIPCRVDSRLGAAAKSPIVQRKTSPIGAVYVTYRY